MRILFGILRFLQSQQQEQVRSSERTQRWAGADPGLPSASHPLLEEPSARCLVPLSLRKVQVSCRTLEGTKVLQQDKQEAVLLLGKTDAAPGLFCAISLCTSNHRLVYLISQSNLCISDVHVC